MKKISLKLSALLFATLLSADMSVTKSVTMMQEKYNLNETKELLLQKAKREAASEIFGDFITSSTNIENGALSNDSVLSLMIGKIRVKGTPAYSNGENLGEIKITVQAYATDSDIAEAKKVLDQRIQALQKAERENPGIVSSQFKALIKTNKGGNQDIFHEGDTIELYIRLNRPGYYYLIGKLDINGKEFPYLVDLDNAKGVDKFIRYVDGENTNKWISQGSFSVEAPFGTEKLQIVASTTPFKTLPKHHFDDQYGYYFIDNISSETPKTRGIKKKETGAVETVKSDLEFVTMPHSNRK